MGANDLLSILQDPQSLMEHLDGIKDTLYDVVKHPAFPKGNGVALDRIMEHTASMSEHRGTISRLLKSRDSYASGSTGYNANQGLLEDELSRARASVRAANQHLDVLRAQGISVSNLNASLPTLTEEVVVPAANASSFKGAGTKPSAPIAKTAIIAADANAHVADLENSRPAKAVENGIGNIVIKGRSRMAGIGEKIVDGARATRSGLWKATKTGGKWAGIATVGALAVSYLVGKRESRANESQDVLNSQQMDAAKAAAASPMIGAPTLMGMEPTPGAMAARVQAARSGNPELGPVNPEVDRNYQVIS